MSILIKGMEMPTRCFNCGMCEVDDTQILCCISHGSYVDYRELDEQTAIQDRPSWCPLVSIPPHGRLIDADALTTVTEMVNGAWRTYIEVFEIDEAPTIIEAEGEE